MTKYLVTVYLTGLLLVFGAYLAWETRKVHISALNDSKLIGLSVYNVIIPCILVIPILGIVFDQPTVQFALTSFLTIFCTTFTLCFVFVPKVSESMKKKVKGLGCWITLKAWYPRSSLFYFSCNLCHILAP